MMRISCAVPPSARISAGIGRCLIRSQILPQPQGAIAYLGENSPPTLAPNQAKPKYMIISASRKSGTARPMKPTKVKT